MSRVSFELRKFLGLVLINQLHNCLGKHTHVGAEGESAKHKTPSEMPSGIRHRCLTGRCFVPDVGSILTLS